jgi:sugar lactone lactonase YvrE
VIKLSHRIVMIFCECLTMSSNYLEFPNLIQDSIGGVRVSIEKNTSEGKPSGMVVDSAASLWIPLSVEKVFKFLTDPIQRFKVH